MLQTTVVAEEVGGVLEPMRPLHVRLPASLHRRLKLAAVEERRTLQEIVTELVTRYLEEKAAGDRR